jgi:ATP-binding cassette subfamily C protein
VNLIRQLWYLLTPREKIEGAFLLGAMALGALFEAVSIGLVVPLVAVLKEPDLLFKVPLIRPLVSALNLREPRQLLVIVGPGLVTVFAIKSGLLMQVYRWLFGYVFKKHIKLSHQLLAGYLCAPYTFHLQRNSAELIRITTRTVEDFTFGFLANLLTLLGEFLVLVAVIILLLFVEPLATLGALMVLAVPAVPMYRSMQHRLGASGRVAEQSLDMMIQWTEQAIGGLKETLVTGRRAFFIDKYDYHIGRFAEAVRSMMFLSLIPRFVIDTLAVSTMVAIAAILLARGQDLLSILPLLGMFAVAAARLMPSVGRIASTLARARFYYPATEVMYQELLGSQKYLVEAQQQGSHGDQICPLPFERSLVLEHLSYCYPDMGRPAIDDISLEIPKGHWIALIGPTGAGKTTLANLILGLLVPSSGSILVDGCNLHDNLAGWQRGIGYVPQSVYLMDDTVRRNVAFGSPEEEIDDGRVWQVLQAAHVDRLVRSLPDGLNAMVGQRGDRLSGGERQRLGIARALYRDPEVLVVDEATANLDAATEAAIGDTLAALRGKKTIIAIAHRLQLVRNCDRIYLLTEGRLRNSGTYSELLSSEPAFLQFPEFSTGVPAGTTIGGATVGGSNQAAVSGVMAIDHAPLPTK